MGGDLGPRCIVPACLAVLKRNQDLHLILVGEQRQIEDELPSMSAELKQRISVHPARENIEMDDSPARILRGKPDASMRVALQIVRDGEVHGCVSAGNTGALMALSKHVLKPLPYIERPAIMASLPSSRGDVYMLDLGANVDCSAKQLVQFAVMASAAVELKGVQKPRVALLNVGLEAIKGNQQVRRAAEALEQMPGLNYIGYIEGDGVYRGDADVIVCDGFAGNVLLKGSEGVARLMAATLSEHVKKTAWRRLLAALNMPMWRELKERWSPDSYNGAQLLGVDGVVVKSHGAASQRAFESALQLAVFAVREKLPQRLEQHILAQPIELMRDEM